MLLEAGGRKPMGGGLTCISELVLVLNEINMFVILVCYLFSRNEETKHNNTVFWIKNTTVIQILFI